MTPSAVSRVSPETRLASLRRANGHRVDRAALRRQLHSLPHPHGLIHALRLAIDPPPPLHSMLLGTLLEACRGIGPAKASELIETSGLLHSRRLIDLSPVERQALRAEIGQHVRGRARNPWTASA